MLAVLLEILEKFLQGHPAVLFAAQTTKSLAVSAEVLVGILASFTTIVVLLVGIVIRSMQKDIKQNYDKVEAVEKYSNEEFEDIRHLHVDELRQHEESDRKRSRRVYDRLEKEYVKKESLGLMLQNMSKDLDDIKGMIAEHRKEDIKRSEKRDEQIHELSEKVLRLETQLGA